MPNRLSLRNPCDVAAGVDPPQAGKPASGGLPRIVGNSFRQLSPLSLPFSLAPSSAALPVRYFGCGGVALGNPPRRLSGDRGRLRPRATRHPPRLPPRQPGPGLCFPAVFVPYAGPRLRLFREWRPGRDERARRQRIFPPSGAGRTAPPGPAAAPPAPVNRRPSSRAGTRSAAARASSRR